MRNTRQYKDLPKPIKSKGIYPFLRLGSNPRFLNDESKQYVNSIIYIPIIPFECCFREIAMIYAGQVPNLTSSQILMMKRITQAKRI